LVKNHYFRTYVDFNFQQQYYQMKKYILFTAAIVITLLVQSCSVNSEITYYKDASSTTLIDIDAKEMMQFVSTFSQDSASIEMSQVLINFPKRGLLYTI
jgi:hypothetical protein